MTSTKRKASKAGFTLVEVLVVLAVLGLLVSLTTTVLHSVSGGLSAVSRADADAEDRSSEIDVLRRLLMQAQPDMMASRSKKTVDFQGASRRIDFLAPLSRHFGAEDIVSYSLYGDEHGVLHFARRLDRPVGEPAIPADDILPGTSDASFSYFGSDDPGHDATWFDSWQDRDHLPSAIRLRFVLNANPVELIVAPMIDKNLY